jgi:hypothetical protein
VYDARDMDPAVRPRTSVIAAWFDGWRRVVRAPWLIGGLITAGAISSALRWHLGASAWYPGSVPLAQLWWVLCHETYAFGGASSWFMGSGMMPVLNSSALTTNLIAPAALLSVFLTGGVLDRIARSRPVSVAHFSGVCGGFFFRFLRLWAGLGAIEWVFWQGAVRWLQAFGTAGMGGFGRPIGYAGVLIFTAFVGIVADVAHVRTVVEDRHSMIGAAAAALRFFRRRPVRVLDLYLMNLVLYVAALEILGRLAPTGASPTGPALGWMSVSVFLWTTLVLRGVTRRGCMGGTIASFQA